MNSKLKNIVDLLIYAQNTNALTYRNRLINDINELTKRELLELIELLTDEYTERTALRIINQYID